MSGIVGIWNLDGRPLKEGLCSRLSATLAHRGPDGEGVWLKGPVGLACQLMRVTPEAAQETQPLVHPLGAVLVLDGRLDNRAELLRLLKASAEVDPASPDPVLVLAAYYTFGERFLERLNGDFALGLFDPKRQRLIIARDAIGVRPLYYWRGGDTFLFASEIKAILAHPQVTPRPHDDLIAELLTGRFSLDYQGETFFAGVVSLLPAHQAILTPEKLVLRSYWDFDPRGRIRLGSFQEYAEGFRHHFEEAVRRRLRSAYPVAVSVSGGLDSSSILCMGETLRQREPERYPPLLGLSLTFAAGTPADEKAFLLEIERRYGISIKQFFTGPIGLMVRAEEEIWHQEAPFPEWEPLHHLYHTSRQLGARVLLNGYMGDNILMGSAYVVDLFRRLRWGEARRHLQEFNRVLGDEDDPRFFTHYFFRNLVRHHTPEMLQSWLRALLLRLTPGVWDQPWLTEAVRRRALRRLARKIHLPWKFPTVHAKSLYIDVRSSYNIIRTEYWNKMAAMHRLDLAYPFLDRDLTSFMMASPGEIHNLHGVPKAILRAALKGVLPEAIRERPGKADFTELRNQGMGTDYPRVIQYLQSGGLAVRFGYVKEEEVRKGFKGLKDRLQVPNLVPTRLLTHLFGLELWLQVFFGDRSREKEVMRNEAAQQR